MHGDAPVLSVREGGGPGRAAAHGPQARAPASGQPQEGEVHQRAEHDDGAGRSPVQAQLLLRQLQDDGQCHQVQAGQDPHPDRVRGKAMHVARQLQVHQLPQDLLRPGHKGHLPHNDVSVLQRRSRGRCQLLAEPILAEPPRQIQHPDGDRVRVAESRRACASGR